MKTSSCRPGQQGVALAVALLFLLVVTVISVIAAGNSSLGLKMSDNLADSYSSFQSAEAGVTAVLSLVDTANDPFTGLDTADPFSAFDPNDHPLSNLRDGAASVDAEVILSTAATTCPLEEAATASSAPLFDCEFYRINSEHEVPREARTQVELGVVKKIVGAGAQ
ncbi:MAG: PilX N-terminal domain-containing pilus assembly protein [Pseudomonadota bacterium]